MIKDLFFWGKYFLVITIYYIEYPGKNNRKPFLCPLCQERSISVNLSFTYFVICVYDKGQKLFSSFSFFSLLFSQFPFSPSTFLIIDFTWYNHSVCIFDVDYRLILSIFLKHESNVDFNCLTFFFIRMQWLNWPE